MMWFTQDCGIRMAVNRNITNRKKMAYLNEEYQHFNYNPDTDWGHSKLCHTGPTLSPECLESGLIVTLLKKFIQSYRALEQSGKNSEVP